MYPNEGREQPLQPPDELPERDDGDVADEAYESWYWQQKQAAS